MITNNRVRITFTLLVGALMMLPANVLARSITAEEAVAVAGEFIGGINGARRHMPDVGYKLHVAHTVSDAIAPRLYVVAPEKGDGFVVVGADTRAGVLGYSTEGVFDATLIPCGLQMMLSSYANDISCLDAEGDDVAANTRRAADRGRVAIAPMIKTSWDQTNPYNSKCPESSYGRMPTGCVATAMAQVMKFHEWPIEGRDLQYTDCNEPRASYDYSIPFEWDLMRSDYTMSGSTKKEREAVGNLMLACGVSVDMMYYPNMSGAFSCLVPEAMKIFFGYDKGVENIERNMYNPLEWEDLVYSELAKGCPLLYGGCAETGAHEFVCDGYESDGYFHINWGWGGNYDGYFRLSALNPEDRGTGGFSGSYDFEQHIIIGIRPPTEGTTGSLPVFINGAISPVAEEDGSIIVSMTEGSRFCNTWREKVSVTPALLFESADGKTTYLIGETTIELPPMDANGNYGKTPLEFIIPASEVKLAAGTYDVTLAYKSSEGSAEPVRPMNGFPYADVTAIVSGGELSFMVDHRAKSDLLSSDSGIVLKTPMRQGQCTSVSFDIANRDIFDYKGTLKMGLFPASTDNPVASEALMTSEPMEISLLAAARRDYSTTLLFDAAPGKYKLVIFSSRDASDNIPAGDFIVVCSNDVEILPAVEPVGTGDIKILWVYPETIRNGTDEEFTIAVAVDDSFTGTFRPRVEFINEYNSQSRSIGTCLETYDADALRNKGGVLMSLRTTDMSCPAGVYKLKLINVRDGNEESVDAGNIRLRVYGCPNTEKGVDAVWYDYDETTGEASALGSIRRGIASVEISNEIVSINKDAVPVTSVVPGAFSGQKMLTTAIVPVNVKNIGARAFAGTGLLKDIRIDAEEPPFTVADNVFEGSGVAWMTVPEGCYDAYASVLPAGFSLSEWMAGIDYEEVGTDGRKKIFAMKSANGTKYIRPTGFDVTTDNPAVCGLKVAEAPDSEGRLLIEISADSKCVVTLTPTDVQPGIAPEPLVVSFDDPQGVKSISIDCDSYPADVYTLDGVFVKRVQSGSDMRMLPVGVYVTSTGLRVIVR